MNKLDVETIRRLSRQQKLSLGNAEKDYILSAALAEISKLPEKMVFKGGTCIKKAYYPEVRFSSDLDFTIPATNNLKHGIEKTFEQKTLHGIKFQKVKSVETRKNNLNLSLQYESQASEAHFIDSIRLEFSTETPVRLTPEDRKLNNPREYALPDTRISCLRLEEILAEKIHAIYHRRKPRDLYDVAYLLEKGVKPDSELIAAKLKPLKIRLEQQTFQQRVALLKETWHDDLKTVMADAPNPEAAEETIYRKLFPQ